MTISILILTINFMFGCKSSSLINKRILVTTDCEVELDPHQNKIQLLSHKEYQNTIEDGLGLSISSVTKDFSPIDRSRGFSNSYYDVHISKIRAKNYIDAAFKISQIALADNEFRKKYISQCTLAETECLSTLISEIGLRLFRRPVEDIEIASFKSIFEEIKKYSGNLETALNGMLAAMLMDHRFLYHNRMIQKESSPRELDNYELAERISYYLWNSSPDEELYSIAKTGTLREKKILEKQVNRMIHDQKAKRTFRHYLTEWLELDNLDSVQRSNKKFPEFNGQLLSEMKEEIYHFFEMHFLENNAPMEAIFDSETSMVGPNLARVYGVQHNGNDRISFDIKESPQRSGVLTLAGILTNLSSGDTTSPVRRGLFINNKFLCEEVPPPPADAGAFKIEVDQREDITPRERLGVHRDSAQCYDCHKVIDPVGLAFENFDAIGKFRTQYENGRDIDPAGFIMFPNDATVKRSFDNFKTLSEILKSSKQTKRCFVQKSMQYATKYRPEFKHLCEVDKIRHVFEKNGGTYMSLISSIIHSLSFNSVVDGGIGSVSAPNLPHVPLPSLDKKSIN